MLTIDEFRKLPEEEKEKRYKELSDYDRFLWRVTCPLKAVDVKNEDMTKEEFEKITKWRKQLLKEGKISKVRFDYLQRMESEPYEIPEELKKEFDEERRKVKEYVKNSIFLVEMMQRSS